MCFFFHLKKLAQHEINEVSKSDKQAKIFKKKKLFSFIASQIVTNTSLSFWSIEKFEYQ